MYNKIYIDIGHNNSVDGGAVGLLHENKVVKEIGNQIQLLFNKNKQSGQNLLIWYPTSASSTGSSLRARADKANQWGADLFISLHCNAFNGKANGTEIYLYSLKGKKYNLATNILNNLVAHNFTNRKCKSRAFSVLRNTNMDSMLIEFFFIDSEKDVNIFNTLGNSFQTRCKTLAWDIVKELVPPIETTHKKSSYYVEPSQKWDNLISGYSCYAHLKPSTEQLNTMSREDLDKVILLVDKKKLDCEPEEEEGHYSIQIDNVNYYVYNKHINITTDTQTSLYTSSKTSQEIIFEAAAYTVEWESRMDSNGNILIYYPPKGDMGGTAEVAGITNKYHNEAFNSIIRLPKEQRKEKCQEYIAKWVTPYVSRYPLWLQGFMTDTTHHRGGKGGLLFIQKAARRINNPIDIDGIFGQETNKFLLNITDKLTFLQAIKQEQIQYEEDLIKQNPVRSKFRKGLHNRINNRFNIFSNADWINL